jgi:hypothetical protein
VARRELHHRPAAGIESVVAEAGAHPGPVVRLGAVLLNSAAL